jgi:Na+/H+-dicarboxylate symporter
MTIAGGGLTLLATLFFKVTLGGVSGSDFTKVLELIYNIVPANIFEPFINGNSLQIIFIAVIFGIAMLMLSSKVSGVFTVVEQLSALVQAVMSVVLEALPFAVFVIFTNMIVSGTIVELLGSYKMILLIFLLVSVYLVGMVLWISLRKKLSPILLIKKALPTFLVALTTASSAAAFSTNVKDANKRLGIDKNLVDFGIPLGQVLFKMSEFAMFIPIVLTFAENYGIAITPVWLILAYITVWLISFAVPPVAGGAIMGFTVVFAQLGIPMEAMAIAIALNAITDFPLTAMNVTGWQLTMIDVADSLGRLDKETLRKKI